MALMKWLLKWSCLIASKSTLNYLSNSLFYKLLRNGTGGVYLLIETIALTYGLTASWFGFPNFSDWPTHSLPVVGI